MRGAAQCGVSARLVARPDAPLKQIVLARSYDRSTREQYTAVHCIHLHCIDIEIYIDVKTKLRRRKRCYYYYYLYYYFFFTIVNATRVEARVTHSSTSRITWGSRDVVREIAIRAINHGVG